MQVLNILPSIFCSVQNPLSDTHTLTPLAGIDVGPVADDPVSASAKCRSEFHGLLSEKQLDGILSPELDKMVTDGKAFALHLGFLKTRRNVMVFRMSACQLLLFW